MKFSFDFGDDRVTKEGFKKVTQESLYDEQLGYGFESIGQVVTRRRSKRELSGDFCIPFNSTFIANVPNGNYIVTVWIGDEIAPTHTSLKTNGQHLVLQNYETIAGQINAEMFGVNVRDEKFILTFGGLAPRINALELTKTDQQIKIYLTGDSTVTDPSKDGYPFSGWGQMLNYFFKHDVVVANHATSGRSTKSFINEGRLERIKEEIREGDYLFIQFGHNDQKVDVERHTDPGSTYEQYLKEYIHVAREKKAIPVLLTSVHRRYYDDQGYIINTHSNYLNAVAKLAEEENILFIDLAARSKQLFEQLGEEQTKEIFLWGAPGEWKNYSNGVADNTHFQEYGGQKIAELVVDGIRDLKEMRLIMFLRARNEHEKG